MVDLLAATGSLSFKGDCAMRQRSLVLALSVVFLVPLVGCKSDDLDVSTNFDPLTSFPTQATYAWDDAANKLPKDPRLAPLDLDSLIKEVADQEFSRRGYRPVATGSPNYRLSYELTVYTWHGPDMSRSVGSLSLLLVEDATNRRVWMGFARAEVHVGLTREERKNRLREVLARMLVKFPPAQRGE
jgi:hypothetical protein